MTSADTAILERIKGAARDVAPLAGRSETERRLPPEAIRLLVSAGVFKLAIPARIGGAEVAPSLLLAACEELAKVDGSVGWCAMIGATAGLMSGYLPEDVAREVYGPDDAVTSAVFAPMGRATRVDGGVRVSGRWPFASGCEHTRFRAGGVFIGEPPERLPNGAPHVQSVLLRAEDTRVLDTWHTSGLRGTGSHDLEATDVFVPDERVFSLVASAPWPGSVLYRMPLFGLLASGVASVAIGIAGGALASFLELAKTKAAGGGKKSIGQRELVQLAVGSASTKVRGARALLHDAVGSATSFVERGLPVPVEERAALRLAACQATAEAAAAVDLVYEAGGGSAIYMTSPLQRAFRDVHTATQHAMVHKTSVTLAGRVLLGLETDTTTL